MPSTLLTDMFELGLPVAEKALRPILVYVFLVAALRLAGKRELGTMNPFDLVVLLMLSNTVQNAIIGDDHSVTGGLIGAAALLSFNHLVAQVTYHNPRMDRMVEGVPKVLVENGEIQQDHLRKELIPQSELEACAHREGFESLAEVERAVLEVDGNVSFVGKKPTPAEARHMAIMRELEFISARLAAQ